jgi:hypothetical protein
MSRSASYEAVGGNPADFGARLRRAEQTLERAADNYRSFIACGGEHCVLPFDTFYSLRVKGTRIRDWVADLAGGKPVRCLTCRAGRP